MSAIKRYYHDQIVGCNEGGHPLPESRNYRTSRKWWSQLNDDEHYQHEMQEDRNEDQRDSQSNSG